MKTSAAKLTIYLLFAILTLGAPGQAASAFGLKDVLNKAKDVIPGNAADNPEQASDEEEFNVIEDATKGAIVCGGLAKIFGKKNSTATKAAIACGAANAAISMLANQGKAEYAEEYRQITEDMVASEKEIAQLEKETKANDKKVASYQSKVKKLIAREKDDKRFIAKAGNLREDMDKQIRSNKKARSTAEAKLEILDQQVADLDVIIDDSPDIEDLKKTRVALLDQKSRLTESVRQANGMNDELVAETSKLDGEIIKRS